MVKRSVFFGKKIIVLCLFASATMIYSLSFAEIYDKDTATKGQLTNLNGIATRVNLDFRNIDIQDFLKFISIKGGLNIVTGPDVQGKVSIFIKNVTIGNALKLALSLNNLEYQIDDEGVIRVITNETYELLSAKKFNERKELKIINFSYLPASDLKAVLGEIKSKTGKVVINGITKTIIIEDLPEKVKEIERLILSMEKPLITKSYDIEYADITKVEPVVTALLSKDVGSVSIDERTGSLIVTDFPDVINRVDTIVNKFDQRSREVLIEAKIVQINLNDKNQYGINWKNVMPSAKSFSLAGVFPLAPAISTGTRLSIGSIPDDDFTAILDLLESYGKTNIVSSPHITVLEGNEAKIHIGTSEPYTSGQTDSTQVSATVSDSVAFIDVGVKLVVTPTISNDDFVRMVIKPEISEKIGTFISPSGQSAVPIVKKTEAETTVMVKDGVTIIIGGLIEDKKSETETAIPFFSKLPFLGFMFRSKIMETIKSELVTFITPHIITGLKNVTSVKKIKRHKPKRNYDKIKKRKPSRS